ncbi:MAG: hypothetical protein ABSA83_22465 [Verrucomicrobiota bacterium]|jgi:hypothetical protein
MNDKSPSGIDPFGRYIVFSGTGMAFMAMCLFLLKPLEHALSDRALPYVIFGIGILTIVVDRVFYHRCSPRTIILTGSIGWLLTFLLLFIWGWFRS